MEASNSNRIVSRRDLLLRDSVTFLTLTLVSAALFGVTLLLFRSFEYHREALSESWSARGRTALAEGRPQQAVAALRAALTYAPEDRGYQLSLAQALAEAGHTEEATNYFLTLWDGQPGDGFINLMLARLSARAGHAQQAIDYYHAAIFGNWSGNGVEIRRDVRLELVKYLAQQHETDQARMQLLVAASNTPPADKLNLKFGDMFQSMGDLPDALQFYRKAMRDFPNGRAPVEKAGSVAYQLGDYGEAHHLLLRALEIKGGAANPAEVEELTSLAARAERLQEMVLTPQLSLEDRLHHLLLDTRMAQARLAGCMAQTSATVAPGEPSLAAAPLVALKARWQDANTPAQRRLVQTDAAAQNERMQLVFDTETDTARVCGPPSGDDALLLLLANQAHGSEAGAPPVEPPAAGSPTTGTPQAPARAAEKGLAR